MSEYRQDILRALTAWATTHGGRLPTSGRLSRETWLELAYPSSHPAPFLTVLGGDSVIWVAGIPIKGDHTLAPRIIEWVE